MPDEISKEQENEFWERHARDESWADIGWFPPIAGYPRRRDGRSVNPDELFEALRNLHVTDRWVPAIHPWPAKTDVDQALRNGKLVEIKTDDLWRVVITAQARDTLTRPNPRWEDPLETPDRILRHEANDACRYAVTSGFNAYLRQGFRTITALSVLCMPYKPHGDRCRDVVITLWEQVRSMAIGAAAGEKAWHDAEEYATGVSPYDGP